MERTEASEVVTRARRLLRNSIRRHDAALERSLRHGDPARARSRRTDILSYDEKLWRKKKYKKLASRRQSHQSLYDY